MNERRGDGVSQRPGEKGRCRGTHISSVGAAIAAVVLVGRIEGLHGKGGKRKRVRLVGNQSDSWLCLGYPELHPSEEG